MNSQSTAAIVQSKQQYHRPLGKLADDNSTKGTGNSSDRNESNHPQLIETLPFENYRTIDSTNRNNNYPGVVAPYRPLDNDEDGHDGDVDEVDDDDHQGQYKHKSTEQILPPSSRPSNLLSDCFSRNIPPSTFLDTSVRSSPKNSSTLMMMMMMKGSAGTGENNHNNRKSLTSSSSSSSLPVDEHQKLKIRRYNFVPAPFNGSRLMAKSTEQLNRSFANDSLVHYPPPPTSILKQKSIASAVMSLSTSKTMHEVCTRLTLHGNNLDFSFIILHITITNIELICSGRFCLDPLTEEQGEDQQGLSNEQKISGTNFEIYQGDDFRKKLMFYEKNASTNDPNSIRRTSFQPSPSKPFDRPMQQIFPPSSSRNRPEHMQRSKSYKDLLDPPIAHPSYYQQPSPASFLNNSVTPNMSGSILGNGSGLTDYQRRQLTINNNLVSDDVSSSSAGHLPKPPPGIPSQNAR